MGPLNECGPYKPETVDSVPVSGTMLERIGLFETGDIIYVKRGCSVNIFKNQTMLLVLSAEGKMLGLLTVTIFIQFTAAIIWYPIVTP